MAAADPLSARGVEKEGGIYKMMKNVIVFGWLFTLLSCDNTLPKSLSQQEMLRIVKENNAKIARAFNDKNADMIDELFTDSAQYFVPDYPIVRGKTQIRKDWISLFEHGFFNFAFTTSTVKGNRDMFYETGNGQCVVDHLVQQLDSLIDHRMEYPDSLLAPGITRFDSASFTYVNVWVLQPDGRYKLDIGTYNNNYHVGDPIVE